MKLISLALTAIVGASPTVNDHFSSSAGGMIAESSPFNRQFQGVTSSIVESNSRFNSENQSFEAGNQVAHDHLLNRRLIGGGNPLESIFSGLLGGGGGGADIFGKLLSGAMPGASQSGGGDQSGAGNPLEALTKSMGGAPSGGDSGGSPLGGLGNLMSMFGGA